MRPQLILHGCTPVEPSMRRLIAGAALASASLMWAIALSGGVARAVEAAPAIAVPPEFDDAELTDVAFVDRWRGWAVGDRGVIWHTADGGSQWQLQSSGVNCRLASVHFLNAKEGWAAGGGAVPPGDLSRGVIVATRDGGRSWQPMARLPLPAVRKLRFFDAKNGWCVGEPSGLFPSSAATTSDGGRTWDPIPGVGSRGWLTGDFHDPKEGVVAGVAGSLAAVRRRSIEPGNVPSLGLRAIHCMQLTVEGTGWLVGDSGLVLATTDGGKTWQVPATEPPDITSQFDWNSIAILGECLWIAGAPGSRILHSEDRGKTWSLQSTGHTLPLNGLHFADSKHGWGVGALGTILATADGGQTWRKQRSGGARAAWLAIYSEPRGLPMELWGRLSAGDGYLGAVDFIARRDTASDARDEVALADRGRQALVELGASAVKTGWRFPLPARGLPLSAEQILENWNDANDGRAIELLEEHLVGELRTWRPEVVVTHAAYPRGDQPLEHLINQVVLRAVEGAADDTRLTHQMTDMGLSPWQVKKVFGGPARGTQDVILIRATELIPRLSQTLADLTQMPRAILNEPLASHDAEVAFRLYFDRIPQNAGAKDFFAGIALPPGGEARRKAIVADPRAAEERRQLAIRTRNLQAVIARSSRAGQGGAEVVGAIGNLVHDLQGPVAGRVLYQLAQDYVQSGQWALAAETMKLLSERYPEHPLAPAALAWMVRFGASSEIGWRLNSGERLLAERTDAAEAGNNAGPDAPVRTADLKQPVQAASLVQRSDRLGIDHERHEPASDRAIEAAKRLEEIDPARASEPSVALPLARAYRARGLGHESDRLLLFVRQSRPHDAWWNCAAGEDWLARPDGLCPKTKSACIRSMARPRLDGELDDATWERAERIDLTGTSKDVDASPAAALFAYDSEFLYFAVSCRRAKGVDYEPAKDSRPRDADLGGRDHLDLILDLDRDAASWYRLSVDDRGFTSDACCEDSHWNPQWYVAAQTVDDVWTVEAAIALDQLTRDYPRSKSAWSVGLQRVVPGVGFQSWTRPAAPTVVSEGLGYLIFE